MDIVITGIENNKDNTKECVKISVTQNCNLSKFIIADTTYNASGDISNIHPHMFWFPKAQVTKGDTITLWTGPGKHNKNTLPNKTTHYNLYWGSRTPIWNNSGDNAIIIEVSNKENHKTS